MTAIQPTIEQIIRTLESTHAKDIVSINVDQLTNITDHMVVCTANALPHLKAIARALDDSFDAKIEGWESEDWILADCDTVVVHIMKAEARDYYRIESLWGKKTKEERNEGQKS